MKRLVLVRHGRTEWNRLGRIQGQTDVSLDDTGVAQAASVAPFLAGFSPRALWSSDLARAHHTALPLAALTGLAITSDPRLRERSFGELEGISHAEFSSRAPRDYDAFRNGDFDQIASAERSVDVAARLRASVDDLLAAMLPGESAVVVSHGASLKLLVGSLIGLTPAASVYALVGMDNCAWSEIQVDAPAGDRAEGAPIGRLVAYNRSAPSIS